ncbi:alanine racemase [Brevibacillus humidisoli]|uniref:alanine racemase n=1 Tax=Brevibacillus humidisoli TaxID=2895522 RepID=UPI001E3E738A|nr:alanine racemase [Brevibacillus humidisoli]UFJ42421.1 alanine racemase [Brevibacillus humidisoli]
MSDTSVSNQMMELAERYGTPLYVYDLNKVREQIATIVDHMHPAVQLFYSLKANPNTTLVRKIYETGTNLEICSLYELKVAQVAGASPDHILYLGPGKTHQEIRQIVDYGVRYIVAESLQELELINQIAKAAGKVVKVGVRVNPEVAVKGARLQMGGTARQFGIDEKQFGDVVALIKRLHHLRLSGIHTYHGTRILSAQVIAENIQYILSFAAQVIQQYQLSLDYVGVGGGLGVHYFAGESQLDVAALGSQTREPIERFVASHKGTSILMESGRYIVAEAGTYLVSVLYTKTSQDIRFAITNGGTHHHMAAGGMGNAFLKNFPIRAFVSEQREMEKYHLSGPLCTPNDLIGKHVELPKLRPGDVIGIQRSGAYGLTASPVLFLSHGLPREVLFDGEREWMIRERDEYMVPRVRIVS